MYQALLSRSRRQLDHHDPRLSQVSHRSAPRQSVHMRNIKTMRLAREPRRTRDSLEAASRRADGGVVHAGGFIILHRNSYDKEINKSSMYGLTKVAGARARVVSDSRDTSRVPRVAARERTRRGTSARTLKREHGPDRRQRTASTDCRVPCAGSVRRLCADERKHRSQSQLTPQSSLTATGSLGRRGAPDGARPRRTGVVASGRGRMDFWITVSPPLRWRPQAA